MFDNCKHGNILNTAAVGGDAHRSCTTGLTAGQLAAHFIFIIAFPIIVVIVCCGVLVCMYRRWNNAKTTRVYAGMVEMNAQQPYVYPGSNGQGVVTYPQAGQYPGMVAMNAPQPYVYPGSNGQAVTYPQAGQYPGMVAMNAPQPYVYPGSNGQGVTYPQTGQYPGMVAMNAVGGPYAHPDVAQAKLVAYDAQQPVPIVQAVSIDSENRRLI